MYYDPKKYRIVGDKTFANLKWVLLVIKKEDNRNYNVNEAIWMLSNNIREDMYERIKDNSFDQTVELENLKGIQEDLLDKLARKEDELLAVKRERDVVLRINSGSGLSKNTVPVEKFEFVLNQLNEETNNYRKLYANMESVRKENEAMKSELDNIKDKSKLSKKNVSAIEKEFLSKFIDNDEEMNNYFEKEPKVEEKKGMDLSALSVNQNVHNFSMNAAPKGENPPQHYERRMSQHSFKKSGREMIPTQGNDSIKDNILKMEEEQKLFAEQLMNIKDELKDTRKQKENFKKLYEQSLTFKDDKKTEIINLLKQAVEKLILEITLTPKIKELLFVILRVIDYKDEEINEILKKKEAKKGGIFGGIFGGKK